ncbi:MAG: ATP-binding protein [Planctomycetes bacterium]|nr:ATP-binding protein [Planctomycetota bacterium]
MNSPRKTRVRKSGLREPGTAENAEKFAEMLFSARDGIITIDDEGNLDYWNPAAMEIFGYGEGELEGKSIHDHLCPPQFREKFRNGFKEFLKTGNGPLIGMTVDVEGLKKDGTTVPLELSISAFKLDGRLYGVGIVRDMTENLRIEEMVSRTERLSALGETVAGIAHELNNPLTGISGFAQLLLINPNSTADTKMDAERILSEAKRCTKIVQYLLSFAGTDAQETRILHLESAFAPLIEILEYELRCAGISLTWEYENKIRTVIGSEARLQQMIHNLISNARDALQTVAEDKKIKLSISSENDNTVVIKIEDNGSGMTESQKARAFDPFFTTKPPGKGTGLGLSICHTIVKEHGGTIEISSSPGAGTRFTVKLPEAKRRKTAPGASNAVSGSRKGPSEQKYALLIDDDPSGREAESGFIEAMFDLEVDVVPSGLDAIDFIEVKDYELIVCDFDLSIMDGEQFYKFLAASEQGYLEKIVFISSKPELEGTRKFIANSGVPFIAKPVDALEFQETVAKVLSEKRRSPENQR